MTVNSAPVALYDEDIAYLVSAAYYALQVRGEQPPALGAMPLIMGHHAPHEDRIDQRFALHGHLRMASQKPHTVSYAAAA